ncbi:hypothetical protein RGQ29_027314 [Quercus rubra]|uniref:Uncharacterized protein n=1 Tax=Quercus rubra TaxID=3512 RepID=A0AAN7IDI2_QUERU|nr:hypothetical protein RGQ29_027314 [Quercus rubra]
MFFIRLLLASAITFCFTSFVFGATVLVDDEIQALRDIAKTLGKTDWNFNEDPCSARSVWAKDLEKDAVNCSCNITNTIGCHVVSMYALSLSLSLSEALTKDLSAKPLKYCVAVHNQNLGLFGISPQTHLFIF